MAGKLSKPYHVRLPLPQAEKFERLAVEANVNMSVFLRSVLTDKKNISIKKLDEEDEQRRTHILLVIGKAGNNLNQIAHSLNTLNVRGELSHAKAIKYLDILENIKANLFDILELYDHQS